MFYYYYLFLLIHSYFVNTFLFCDKFLLGVFTLLMTN